MTYCLVWTQLDARSIDQLTMYIQQLMYTVCYRICHLLNFAIKLKKILTVWFSVLCLFSWMFLLVSCTLSVTLNGSFFFFICSMPRYLW